MADVNDENKKVLIFVVAFSVLLKLLFLPTYRSTDFEVHRNWLAITHTLPVSKWYFEETSQWTLDYPPFFAWFEFLLSHIASWVDPGMVCIQNLEYASLSTIVFQRLTVIAADMVLVYACYQYYNYFTKLRSSTLLEQQKKGLLTTILVILNFGFLVVDHVHFQYNGFLFGILILSVTRMLEDQCLWSAFWFSVLLNFKHIYLYIAPAYFVYLLRSYCFKRSTNFKKSWIGVRLWDILPLNLIKLGIIVITVFAASFAPFLVMGQIQQVLARLFPFKRGLCHAYWAPNFWAFYNVLDKFLTVTVAKLGIGNVLQIQTASMTSGLIGQSQHTILPSILPLTTIVLTLISMLPCLLKLWYRPTGPKDFLKALVLCAYSSFIFGWHVHEKAVLLITIPLSLLALENVRYGRVFLIISTAGNVSLFPLLFQPVETPIKIILMMMFTLFTLWSFDKTFRLSAKSKQSTELVSWYEKCYLAGIALLEVYNLCLHTCLGLSVKYPFLPLLLTSFYCAIGVFWSWLLFCRTVLFHDTRQKTA